MYPLKLLFLLLCLLASSISAKTINVGSKPFTENIIWGEILTQHLQENGISAQHKASLGGSQIVWKALQNGDIDLYVEYSGTLEKELLHHTPPNKVKSELQKLNLHQTKALGFNNTYALGMKKERAEELNIKSISDLQKYPDLVFGFYNEFIDRQDGWLGIKQAYQLEHENVLGMEHALSYKALNSGKVDVVDLYSTDANIAHYGLVSLEDNKHFFPKYYASILYRADLVERHPEAKKLLQQFEGTINESEMITLNKTAQIDRVPEAEIARQFLSDRFDHQAEAVEVSRWKDLLSYSKAHIWLVIASLFPAIFLAIPLGICAAYFKWLAAPILGLVSILQTLPALALLMFMIPLFGIGSLPAIAALFLYSLLPITRNTYVGVHLVANSLKESASALGLPKRTILQKIELPLAMPTIIAGIKTAAVINVGTATLGAFIGAGGLGEPIITGLRLDDHSLIILMGALPAAGLAILTLSLFSLIEYWIVPKGLKLK